MSGFDIKQNTSEMDARLNRMSNQEILQLIRKSKGPSHRPHLLSEEEAIQERQWNIAAFSREDYDRIAHWCGVPSLPQTTGLVTQYAVHYDIDTQAFIDAIARDGVSLKELRQLLPHSYVKLGDNSPLKFVPLAKALEACYQVPELGATLH